MIPGYRDHAEEMLTPAQLDYAAEYVLRWNNLHPDELSSLKRQAVEAMRRSVMTRALVGAALRDRAPIKGNCATLCGKRKTKWPSAEDAWVCHSSGDHSPAINEVR